MARIKVICPDHFSFKTIIPVRITDLNYGGHVGNDTILTLVHEARMQYLQSLGYQELDLEGVGLIMADAALEFKAELFYGDQVIAEVAAIEFSRVGFDLVYRFSKKNDEREQLVALAKTGMVCFHYKDKKIAPLPEPARQKLK